CNARVCPSGRSERHGQTECRGPASLATRNERYSRCLWTFSVAHDDVVRRVLYTRRAGIRLFLAAESCWCYTRGEANRLSTLFGVIVAPDLRLARQDLRYITGAVDSSPELRSLMVSSGTDSLT